MVMTYDTIPLRNHVRVSVYDDTGAPMRMRRRSPRLRRGFTTGSDEEAVQMGASVPVEESGTAELGERLEDIEGQLEQLQAAVVIMSAGDELTGDEPHLGSRLDEDGVPRPVRDGRRRTARDETTAGSSATPLDNPRRGERGSFMPNMAGTISGREFVTAKTLDPGNTWTGTKSGDGGDNWGSPHTKDARRKAAFNTAQRLATNDKINLMNARNAKAWGR